MTFKTGKSISQILKHKLPDRRFNIVTEKNMTTIYYDAYLTENEEMLIHEILDKAKVNYRMIRMEF